MISARYTVQYSAYTVKYLQGKLEVELACQVHCTVQYSAVHSDTCIVSTECSLVQCNMYSRMLHCGEVTAFPAGKGSILQCYTGYLGWKGEGRRCWYPCLLHPYSLWNLGAWGLRPQYQHKHVQHYLLWKTSSYSILNIYIPLIFIPKASAEFTAPPMVVHHSQYYKHLKHIKNHQIGENLY